MTTGRVVVDLYSGITPPEKSSHAAIGSSPRPEASVTLESGDSGGLNPAGPRPACAVAAARTRVRISLESGCLRWVDVASRWLTPWLGAANVYFGVGVRTDAAFLGCAMVKRPNLVAEGGTRC